MLEWTVVVLLAIVFYTYVGYPAAVKLWAKLAPTRRPILNKKYRPTVSVCMPVHNGESYLHRKLRSLATLKYPKDKLEIVIYDDGSSDETAELLAGFAAQSDNVRVLYSVRRRGKPHALEAMVRAAKGEVLLMTDVRPLLDPKAVRALVKPLADEEVACVSGNLEMVGESGAGAYWRYEKFIREAEAQTGNLAGVTGAVYAIRKQDFPRIPGDTILDDMWVPIHAARARDGVIAFAKSARAYDQAFGDEREFSRKARTLAGNYQLLFRRPSWFVPSGSPVWFSLVSHKLMRLVCPWAMMLLYMVSGALSISAIFLPTGSPLELLAIITFLGINLLASLALVGDDAGRLGRLARSFVIFNGAALVGLWRWAARRQRVTW
jgi:cellulose synthase/poly-beta-1,6-N-acetylglucosamine synthase-like glycosyltransferase